MIALPTVPPSSNNAYQNDPFGGRKLSEEGRSYKTQTKGYLTSRYPAALTRIRKDVPYFILIHFYFVGLENRTWPKRAETRYKKFDVDNRLKLFLDALKDACGIDDSQFVAILVVKLEGPSTTEAYMWNLDKEVRSVGELVQSVGL